MQSYSWIHPDKHLHGVAPSNDEADPRAAWRDLSSALLLYSMAEESNWCLRDLALPLLCALELPLCWK